MKKIILGLLSIVAIAAFSFGYSRAFFSDVEKSSANTVQAGQIDLKIDHTKETYNDIDCKTCSVVLISDSTNMVVARNGIPFATPYPAVNAWVHPAWTAQNDPPLLAAGAKWIWEANPTKQIDTTSDVIYTFRKEFTWWGPITGSDLTMAVGHDNTVEIWLNGVLIGQNTDIYGFQINHMLHVPAANIYSNIAQGNNILEIKIKNVGQVDGNPEKNPAGIVYKFEINGNCQQDYFKNQCRLWGLKDLDEDDFFWKFDDLKPGDRGTNVISYHVFDNDAWLCTSLQHDDLENVIVEPEAVAGDVTDPLGELSKYIEVFVWGDDSDGLYEPGSGESSITQGTLSSLNGFPLAEPPASPLVASQTKYIGIAWCFGDLTVDPTTGAFSCDGTANLNDAQTDIVNDTVRFYAEQSRNNPDFACPGT